MHQQSTNRMPPGVRPPRSHWTVIYSRQPLWWLAVQVTRQPRHQVEASFNPGALWQSWWSWRVRFILGRRVISIYRVRVEVTA